MTRDQALARWIALLLPAALLAGAWGSQLWGGLYPCEMCHWQRWPHYAAVVVALFSFFVPGRSAKLGSVAVAAILIAVSGAIGVFHAGVEWHWWQGVTACSTTVSGTNLTPDQMLQQLMNAPIVRCDAAQWRLLGISLAGWNAIFSLGGAFLIARLLTRSVR